MVKITEPEGINSQNSKVENTSDFDQLPTIRQNKNKKIQLRLTPAVEQQLREYAGVKDTSITDAVERIITKKFYNKKINRKFFNLDQPSNILVPITNDLLYLYDKHQINLVANVKKVDTNQYSFQLFDKQAELYNQYPDQLEVVTIQQVNNVYDDYDPVQECYYSKYNLGDNEDKYLNHLGLIILSNEVLEEDSITTFKLPILVNTYEGTLREAKVLKITDAIQRAVDKEHDTLKEYLEDPKNEVMALEEIKSTIDTNQELVDVLNRVETENILLQEQLTENQAETDEELQEKVNELQLENQVLRDKLNNLDTVVDKRVYDKLQDMMDSVTNNSFQKNGNNNYNKDK